MGAIAESGQPIGFDRASLSVIRLQHAGASISGAPAHARDDDDADSVTNSF
jgi:hypothetical protein